MQTEGIKIKKRHCSKEPCRFFAPCLMRDFADNFILLLQPLQGFSACQHQVLCQPKHNMQAVA